MKVKIYNVSNNPNPSYETKQAAGMDVRVDFSRIEEYPIKVYGHGTVMPKNEVRSVTGISLTPGSRALLPTGLFMEIPEGYEAQIRPRSGLSLKSGIVCILGTIDSDFRGEIGLIVVNQSNTDIYIEDGERIGQIVFNKVEQVEFESVNSKEELNKTARGENGFGSTKVK